MIKKVFIKLCGISIFLALTSKILWLEIEGGESSLNLRRLLKSPSVLFLSLMEELRTFSGSPGYPGSSSSAGSWSQEQKIRVLEEMIKLGEEFPEFMAEKVRELLEDVSLQEEMIYILGKIEKEVINEELIQILKDLALPLELREGAALALAHKSDSDSIQALKDVLGPERSAIYDEFGVWVIDIRVDDSTKFTSQELERIKVSLRNIPPEHLQRGVNVILRRYLQEPHEIYPDEQDWMPEEFSEVWRTVPLGSYAPLNKIVNVNFSEELERIIYHEIGHAVHHYTVDQEGWKNFVELHKRPGMIGYDYAYPYGSTHPYEDFATIYEMLLNEPEHLQERASISELLNEKVEFVKSYFP